MGFKIDDRVVLTNIANWYGGALNRNDKCTVTYVGLSSPDTVIWVRNTKGIKGAVYTSWASKLKNQQLLFDFMYRD